MGVRIHHFMTKLVVLLLCLTFIVNFFAFISKPSAVNAAESSSLSLNVSAAILLEVSTGQVLYELNADKPFPPASMAKMMTEYIVLDRIQSGKLGWDDIVTTTKNAETVIGSGQLLGPGEKLSVRDMFYQMAIYSSNDAAVALAEHISGTEEKFAELMNQTATKLGLTSAHFINATGLSRADMLDAYKPASIDGETVISARDVGMLAYHLLRDEDQKILEFTQITKKKLRETDNSPMTNWNKMLEGWGEESRYSYKGMDGLKTGHTDDAGYCFTGTAERDGLRFISVVMGTESYDQDFSETAKLMDYGFNHFEVKTVVTAKSEISQLKTVAVRKGNELEVPIVLQNGLTMVVDKDAKDSDFIITAEPSSEDGLVAPIAQGDVVGTATIKYKDIVHQINLIAAADVEKASWTKLFFRSIKHFFKDLFSGISNGIKNLF